MTDVSVIIDNMEILSLTAILLLVISFFILFVKYKNKIHQALIFLASFSPFSSVRILLYRFLGMNIGKNVSIGYGTMIWSLNLDDITIGDNVTINDNIKLIPKGGCSIGSDTYLKDEILAKGDSNLVIGNCCYIGRQMFIDCTETVDIGNNVFMSYGKIWTHNFAETVFVKGFPSSRAPVKIGSNTWMGPEVYIVSGVTISENSFIQARSFVVTDTKPFFSYAGSPARAVSNLQEKFSDLRESIDLTDEIKSFLAVVSSEKEFPKDFGIAHTGEIYYYYDHGQSIFLCDEVKNDFLSFLESEKHKKQLVIGNFENCDNSVIKRFRNGNTTLFDVKSCFYYPLNFNRQSLTWSIKNKMRSIGIYLSSMETDNG